MSLRSVWSSSFARTDFRIRLIVTIPLLVATLASLANFLTFVESRKGVTLPDPVLMLFTAHDVTWLTFALIYIGLVVGIVFLLRHPDSLLIAVQSYILMIILRIGAMYALPLEPPPGMIALKDPFVEFFGTGTLLTKDLFFSGHTATLFLLFLASNGKFVKAVFLVCTIVVAVCVIVQHVHYTIDVLAAPFFAFGAFRLAMSVNRRIHLPQE